MILVSLVRLTRRLRARRGASLAAIAAVLAFAILGNAITFLVFERSANPELSVEDALWYSLISITTIGYGDFFPTTTPGRLGTVFFVIVLGLGAFSVALGMTIDAVNSGLTRGRRGLGRAMARDHALIVNVPSLVRVRQLVEEIRSERSAPDEIVIVANDLEELPDLGPDVTFIRGSTHDAETFDRADVCQARMAIVLSRDYGDADSDALVAATVSVLDRARPELFIVAECVDPRHRTLFDAVRCDAIVPGLHIAGNLLVQEVHDPGVSGLIETLTSNRKGATVYTTAIPDGATVRADYRHLAADLLERDVNLIAWQREGTTRTELGADLAKPGDRLVYIAVQRSPWEDLAGAAAKG